MPPSTGVVQFANGTILFFESDVHPETVSTHLYETVHEVVNKCKRGTYTVCHCSREEEVSLFYQGSYYVARACQYCYRLQLDVWQQAQDYASQTWAAELGDWNLINTDDGEHIFRIRTEDLPLCETESMSDDLMANALAAFKKNVINYARQHGWEATLKDYPNTEIVEEIYEELMMAQSVSDSLIIKPQ